MANSRRCRNMLIMSLDDRPENNNLIMFPFGLVVNGVKYNYF
jgi:hypothetical protein